jgi:7-cyano-7-deazaguanine synthase
MDNQITKLPNSPENPQIPKSSNPQIPKSSNPQASAVLLSGGLDSAVLLVEEASRGEVHPVYVSAGLAWEQAERDAIARFLASGRVGPRVQPLVSLTVDMHDVYTAAHWSIQGRPPAYHTPDEDVYLPGRNIILLAKAGMYCAAARLERLVLGTLAHNPFPDATPEFRSAMARALSLGLAHTLRIEAPYAEISKAEVVRRGARLGVPLELTLSCMNPPGTGLRGSDGDLSPARHCGACSKCRERHDAFLEAGITDTTHYADRTNIG